MYEHFRNEVIANLDKYFSMDQINIISSILDKVAADYDFTEKETMLAVADDKIFELLKLYIVSKKIEQLADRSIKGYYRFLNIFFNEIRKDPKEITTNEIRLFLINYQQKRKISDRTLDKYRQIINAFYTWLIDEEYVNKNPCKNINKIKYEVIPRKSLTRLEFEKLRRACINDSRTLAIVDVLYSTACRVSELVNMKFSDIENNSIKIIGKGKKHNIVYLNTNAQLSLNEYLKNRKGNSDYIFVSKRKPYKKLSTRSVQLILNKLAKKLGFKVFPHKLRHTTATFASQNGMPIAEIQKMLGHSNINTTMIYAETSQESIAESHKHYIL